jgi:hypothetical protein
MVWTILARCSEPEAVVVWAGEGGLTHRVPSFPRIGDQAATKSYFASRFTTKFGMEQCMHIDVTETWWRCAPVRLGSACVIFAIVR